MRGLKSLYLDMLAVPSLLMTKKANALYHLKYICPKCPKERKALRSVNNDGECWWYANWKKGRYGIPKNFGISNWFRQYALSKTDLSKFRKK